MKCKGNGKIKYICVRTCETIYIKQQVFRSNLGQEMNILI